MSNDAKKVSQLGVTTTLTNTDRVVVLHDPSGSPSVNTITKDNFFASFNKLSTNDVTVNSEVGVDQINYIIKATTLSLSKQVQKLGTGGLDQDHHYYLPDGFEGQIMYFTAKTGAGASGHLLVWMQNMRLPDGSIITDSYWLWNGGGWDRSTAFAIFTDGAWNINGGDWGP
jgi:hypothetical protein